MENFIQYTPKFFRVSFFANWCLHRTICNTCLFNHLCESSGTFLCRWISRSRSLELVKVININVIMCGHLFLSLFFVKRVHESEWSWCCRLYCHFNCRPFARSLDRSAPVILGSPDWSMIKLNSIHLFPLLYMFYKKNENTFNIENEE